MSANFDVTGIIVKLKPSSEGRNGRPPSAKLTLQFGARRDNTENDVQFVNALVMRIPGHIWARNVGTLREGMVVEVKGKLQGVLKAVADGASQNLVAELVVESLKPVRADFLQQMATSAATAEAALEASAAAATKATRAEGAEAG